jgi:hypothetical protein
LLCAATELGGQRVVFDEQLLRGLHVTLPAEDVSVRFN